MPSTTGSGGEGVSTRKEHKMGVFSCTNYVIGNIIGSGIFVTASSVTQNTNSVGMTLVVWLVCALISFLGAIVYIELATAIPDSGADYAYAMRVQWRAIAFGFMLVSAVITFPASAAVQSITFGQYLTKFVSGLTSSSSDASTTADPTLVILFAMLLLVSLTLLNFFSLDKFASTFQVVVTLCKVVSIGAIVAIGVGYCMIYEGKTENFKDPFNGTIWDIGMLTMGTYSGLWSYAGWDILNYGTPEIQNPRSTMPLSILFGLAVVATAYILVNVAFFSVMTIAQVSASVAIGDEFARLALGNGFAKVIPIMIAVLVMGTLNSNIFCGSRVIQKAANEGQLPAFLSGIHPSSGSPRPAVLMQAVFAIIMCFVPVDTLVNSVTFVMWTQKAFTAAALIYIRYKNVPVEESAIRVPIILTWMLLIISIALVVIPFITDLTITLIGCGVIAAAFAVYFLAIRFAVCGCGGFYDKISDMLNLIVKKTLCVDLDLKMVSTTEERRELNGERKREEEDEPSSP